MARSEAEVTEAEFHDGAIRAQVVGEDAGRSDSGSAASSAIVRPAKVTASASDAAGCRRTPGTGRWSGTARPWPAASGSGIGEGLHDIAPGAHVRALVGALDPVRVPHRDAR